MVFALLVIVLMLHFIFQTIFYDLPCLSLLSDDEWMAVNSLLNVVDVSLLPIKSDVPIRSEDKVLAESVPAPWVVKAAGKYNKITFYSFKFQEFIK